MPISIAIAGASGRLGSRCLAACLAAEGLEPSAALVSAASPHLGSDAGRLLGLGPQGLLFSRQPEADFGVLLDASQASALGDWIELCRSHSAALVVAATGHVEAQLEALAVLAREVPVLRAPNLALGPNLLMRLVREAASRLGAGYEVHIEEVHHAGKRDAPSGTARSLAQGIAALRGAEPSIESQRRGQVVGEHKVTFSSEGDSLTLSHSAHKPEIFSAGAIVALRWIAQQAPGLYAMEDLLDELGSV